MVFDEIGNIVEWNLNSELITWIESIIYYSFLRRSIAVVSQRYLCILKQHRRRRRRRLLSRVIRLRKTDMEYKHKLVLAPMVRVGTLPLRLLAADYGADITYGEEIIDHKLIKCERRINEVIGTTDIVEKGTENVVFRTCHEESARVVFQMGTSDAVRALAAAQIVCKDVAAVDVNMGCPKSFSISGGMGAALLNKPELIHDILTTLKRNLNMPVTCKIRLLNASQDTVELARRIEKAGVSALAVHGRRVADRPRDPAKWSEIADVVAALSIPVIANGDVFEYEDIQRIQVATGATSVMIARGALWNASIFSPKGKVPWEQVKREYVRKSILWDNDVKSTKHTLKEMIMHFSCLELPEGKAVTKSETLGDLAQLYGEDNYYELVNANRGEYSKYVVNNYVKASDFLPHRNLELM
ncbi:hypothetical protein Vadar_034056 [Vaccinium darrowii]|uniref:Uncharacterized protein n=1 Tax=Vaccinium darrowii TaxID=229202 RepID=A0ACB7Y3K1_9ERIC|nr:hypothetical protein Vadar_034056 [Vaccinium darrowii]